MDDERLRMLATIGDWRPEVVKYFAYLLDDVVDPDVMVPEVVEYRGCLLNKRVLANPHLSDWFSDKYSDRQREYVLNHMHLWDLTWIHSDRSKDEEAMRLLREFLPVLAEFWRWHLARQISLPVNVWTADEPEEYGPTIGFGLVR